MQTYVTSEAGTFQIKPFSAKVIAAAAAQLRKEGHKIETLDLETSPMASGEIARQCLSGWTVGDGVEPLKGLTPKAARDILMEDPYVSAFVLAKAREQADEWAKRFEVVSGN
jgi:hypothetical protein